MLNSYRVSDLDLDLSTEDTREKLEFDYAEFYDPSILWTKQALTFFSLLINPRFESILLHSLQILYSSLMMRNPIRAKFIQD